MTTLRRPISPEADGTASFFGGDTGAHLVLDEKSARLLTIALGLSALFLAVDAVILFSAHPDQWLRLPSNFIALIVCALTYIPLRRRDGPGAVSVSAHGCFVWIALSAPLGGGLHTPVLIILPVLVVISGLLLGRRLAVRFAALSYALALALLLAHEAGWQPAAPPLPVGMVFGILMAVLTMALVMAVFAGGAHAKRLRKIQKLNGQLEISHREFLTLAENLPAMVMRTDLDLKVTYANRLALEFSELRSEQVIGHPLKDSMQEESFQRFMSVLDAAKLGKRTTLLVPRVSEASRRLLELTLVCETNADNQPTGFLAVAYDVTEREQLAVELRKAATHDALTGIANRAQIDDSAESALERAKRRNSMFALVVIDLDGFKLINDTYGHAAGDQVLRHVARQLVESVRSVDRVGRIGGDEFVVICEEIAGAQAIHTLAEKMLAAICQPTEFEGHALSVGASIGFARYPSQGNTVRELFQRADAAMYAAKNAGKNCVRPVFKQGDASR